MYLSSNQRVTVSCESYSYMFICCILNKPFFFIFPLSAALLMLILCIVQSNSYPTVYTASESEIAGGCIDAEWFRDNVTEFRGTVDDIYEEFVSDLDKNTLIGLTFD